MPRAILTLGTACVLSAAIAAGSCVAQHPKQTPLASAEAKDPNTISTRFNKASLVGCWTWLQEDGDDDWLCFDKEGHYVIVVSYDRMGRDNVGTYDVTSDSQLVFKEEDEIIGTKSLKILPHNFSEISLSGISRANSPIVMELRKDKKNDFYKEISRTYF